MTHRSFCTEDQHAFAKLSGDYNPLHVDPVVARRFMYGGVVVHGVHLLLHAIESLLAGDDPPISLSRLEAEFRAPVRLGVPVRFNIERPQSGRAFVTALMGETLALRATVAWSDRCSATLNPLPATTADANATPEVLGEEDMLGIAGTTPLFVDQDQLARRFPILSARVAASQIAAVLASTRVVGMHCPGYHSVFSDLAMEFTVGSSTEPAIEYRLTGYDDRFRLASIQMAGAGQEATLKAFLRPPPSVQPGTRELSAFVEAGEFSGRRALVVGGSRGLGELAAKLLAAGGASVALTYRSGREDAERVTADIASAGGMAQSLQYAAGQDPAPLARVISELAPTDLLYFATPKIQRTDRGFFSAKHFADLCAVYIDGFLEVFALFAGVRPLPAILYPSSVAIEELPKDMVEYAAAKAAGENICRSLMKRHRGLRISMPRLPRLPTDQTASLLERPRDAPVEYFVQLLRQLNERPDEGLRGRHASSTR
jgi:NAD(P)-dependent dehydrogenase (short-subunit alcohol dehydrogenase family)